MRAQGEGERRRGGSGEERTGRGEKRREERRGEREERTGRGWVDEYLRPLDDRLSLLKDDKVCERRGREEREGRGERG